jgi:hypothetical protein
MKGRIFHRALPLYRITILSKPTPTPEFLSMPAASSLDSILVPYSPIILHCIEP